VPKTPPSPTRPCWFRSPLLTPLDYVRAYLERVGHAARWALVADVAASTRLPADGLAQLVDEELASGGPLVAHRGRIGLRFSKFDDYERRNAQRSEFYAQHHFALMHLEKRRPSCSARTAD
jgi:hypothetical protein